MTLAPHLRHGGLFMRVVRTLHFALVGYLAFQSRVRQPNKAQSRLTKGFNKELVNPSMLRNQWKTKSITVEGTVIDGLLLWNLPPSDNE